MRSVTKHKNKTMQFSTICGILIAISISIMTVIIYFDNTDNTVTDTNKSNHYSETIEFYDLVHTRAIDENFTNDYVAEFEYSTNESDVKLENPVQIETEPTKITEPTQPEEEKVLEYKYGRRMTPSVNIDIPTGDDMKNFTDEVDTSNYEYLGKFAITGYTPKCKHCCGNTKGITASGVEAIAGYTVATSKSIPFGTTLYIEGYGYYMVEDRGAFSHNLIDIAAPSHDACYKLTNNEINVYIVPHEN